MPVKKCSKCGAEKPATTDYYEKGVRGLFGLRGECKTCRAAYRAANKDKAAEAAKRWRERHPERAREASRAWAERNAEAVRERHRAARNADPEKHREKVRRSYRAHHEKRLADRRAYGKSHQEEHRLYEANYRKCFPFKYKEQRARRRAKLRNASWEVLDYEAIYERDEGLCHICKLPVEMSDLSFDHIVPFCAGGAHLVQNVAVAHVICNNRKNKVVPKDSV